MRRIFVLGNKFVLRPVLDGEHPCIDHSSWKLPYRDHLMKRSRILTDLAAKE